MGAFADTSPDQSRLFSPAIRENWARWTVFSAPPSRDDLLGGKRRLARASSDRMHKPRRSVVVSGSSMGPLSRRIGRIRTSNSSHMNAVILPPELSKRAQNVPGLKRRVGQDRIVPPALPPTLQSPMCVIEGVLDANQDRCLRRLPLSVRRTPALDGGAGPW